MVNSRGDQSEGRVSVSGGDDDDDEENSEDKSEESSEEEEDDDDEISKSSSSDLPSSSDEDDLMGSDEENVFAELTRHLKQGGHYNKSKGGQSSSPSSSSSSPSSPSSDEEEDSEKELNDALELIPITVSDDDGDVNIDELKWNYSCIPSSVLKIITSWGLKEGDHHKAKIRWDQLGLGWKNNSHNSFLYCSDGREAPLRFRGGAKPVAALLAKGISGVWEWGNNLWEHVENKRRRRERIRSETEFVKDGKIKRQSKKNSKKSSKKSSKKNKKIKKATKKLEKKRNLKTQQNPETEQFVKSDSLVWCRSNRLSSLLCQKEMIGRLVVHFAGVDDGDDEDEDYDDVMDKDLVIDNVGVIYRWNVDGGVGTSIIFLLLKFQIRKKCFAMYLHLSLTFIFSLSSLSLSQNTLFYTASKADDTHIHTNVGQPSSPPMSPRRMPPPPSLSSSQSNEPTYYYDIAWKNKQSLSGRIPCDEMVGKTNGRNAYGVVRLTQLERIINELLFTWNESKVISKWTIYEEIRRRRLHEKKKAMKMKKKKKKIPNWDDIDIMDDLSIFELKNNDDKYDHQNHVNDDSAHSSTKIPSIIWDDEHEDDDGQIDLLKMMRKCLAVMPHHIMNKQMNLLREAQIILKMNCGGCDYLLKKYYR